MGDQDGAVTPGDDELRPWYRLHVLTVILGSIVFGTLLYRQFHDELLWPTFFHHGFASERSAYGWPFLQLEIVHFWEIYATNPIHQYRYEWFTWRPFANAAICLLLVLGTAVALERWQRRDRPWQFGIRSFLILIAVVALLLIASREDLYEYRDHGEDEMIDWSLIGVEDALNPVRWPIVFSIVCTLFGLLNLVADWIGGFFGATKV